MSAFRLGSSLSISLMLTGMVLDISCVNSTVVPQKLVSGELASSPSGLSFVHLTDTHFDPFYDSAEAINNGVQRQPKYIEGDAAAACLHWSDEPAVDFPLDSNAGGSPFGEYGADDPLNTLVTMLRKAKTKNPAFAVVTGDLLTHALWGQTNSTTPPACKTIPAGAEKCCNDALASLQITVDRLADTFQDKVIIALGNNDSLPKNQFDPTWGETLAKIYKEKNWLDDTLIPFAPTSWGTIDATHCKTQPSGPPPKTSFESFKLFGGYYRHWTKATDIHFIVLDTVIYLQDKKSPTGLKQPCLAAQQWQWVQELTQKIVASDANAQIYIAGHIPPTHLKGTDLLDQKFIYDYQVYVEKYKENIKGQFYGDQNVDITRVYLSGVESRLSSVDGSCTGGNYKFSEQTAASWFTLASGISPRMNNNPSFNWYGIQSASDATISNYQQEYLNLPASNKAASAVFGEINFGLPVINGGSILTMLNSMTVTAKSGNIMDKLDQLLLASSPDSSTKATSLDPVVRRCAAMYHSECEIKNCCTANNCCASVKSLKNYKPRRLDMLLCPK